MAVPGQHLHALVAGYSLDLHNIKILFSKKTAGHLMTQVVEAEIFNPCLPAGPGEAVADIVSAEAEHTAAYRGCLVRYQSLQYFHRTD